MQKETHGLPGPSSEVHQGYKSAASVSCAGLQEAAPGPADGANFLQNLLRCPLSKVSHYSSGFYIRCSCLL